MQNRNEVAALSAAGLGAIHVTAIVLASKITSMNLEIDSCRDCALDLKSVKVEVCLTLKKTADRAMQKTMKTQVRRQRDPESEGRVLSNAYIFDPVASRTSNQSPYSAPR